MARVRVKWPHFKRDSLFLVMGVIGFFHELFASGPVRLEILIASFALMGVPLFLERGTESKDKMDPK